MRALEIVITTDAQEVWPCHQKQHMFCAPPDCYSSNASGPIIAAQQLKFTGKPPSWPRRLFIRIFPVVQCLVAKCDDEQKS